MKYFKNPDTPCYVPRFSVLLPAYRDLGSVFETIERLFSEERDVEFVVGADLWSEGGLRRLEELSRRIPVKITASRERRGKVRALNDMIRMAEGEILVFIDSDVRIVSRGLLEAVGRALERGEFGGGRIQVRGETILERFVRIDYLGINAAIRTQELSGVSFGVNGAFMFAKREVVERIGGFLPVLTEDSDFGYRASEAGFRPVFAGDAVVETSAPKTLKEWFRQRVRWAIGGVQAARIHEKFHWGHPLESALQATAMFPFWIPFLVLLLAPGALASRLLAVLASLASTQSQIIAVLAWLGWIGTIFAHPAVSVIGFAFTFLWWEYWKRELKFEGINPLDYVGYYFLYAPLWAAVLLGAIAYVAVCGPEIESCCGWKVKG